MLQINTQMRTVGLSMPKAEYSIFDLIQEMFRDSDYMV